MRRIPIRMKLAAALVVPLLALVTVTSLKVVDAAAEAQTVLDQVALAEISLGPSGVLSAIEEERNAVGVHLLGQGEAFTLRIEDPAEAAQITDEAIATFRAEVERQGPDIVAAYAPAFRSMAELSQLRADVQATPDAERTLSSIEEVSVNFDGYSAIVDSLARVNKRVALAIDDVQLRQGAELVDLNSRQTNLVAILVRELFMAQLGGPADGVNTPREIFSVARKLDELRTGWDEMAGKGTGPYAPLVEDLLAAEEVQTFPQVVQGALDTEVVDIPDLITYAANDDPETLAYTVFGEAAKDLVREHAAALTDAAESRQRSLVATAGAALVVAGLVAWLVSRSITRPLRSLTRQAKDMAERRLPDAVIDILETP
ncbi:MAG TPA: hypothetical protein VFZ79_19030, partial [Acidimicrobiales bacterium]